MRLISKKKKCPTNIMFSFGSLDKHRTSTKVPNRVTLDKDLLSKVANIKRRHKKIKTRPPKPILRRIKERPVSPDIANNIATNIEYTFLGTPYTASASKPPKNTLLNPTPTVFDSMMNQEQDLINQEESIQVAHAITKQNQIKRNIDAIFKNFVVKSAIGVGAVAVGATTVVYVLPALSSLAVVGGHTAIFSKTTANMISILFQDPSLASLASKDFLIKGIYDQWFIQAFSGIRIIYKTYYYGSELYDLYTTHGRAGIMVGATKQLKTMAISGISGVMYPVFAAFSVNANPLSRIFVETSKDSGTSALLDQDSFANKFLTYNISVPVLSWFGGQMGATLLGNILTGTLNSIQVPGADWYNNIDQEYEAMIASIRQESKRRYDTVFTPTQETMSQRYTPASNKKYWKGLGVVTGVSYAIAALGMFFYSDNASFTELNVRMLYTMFKFTPSFALTIIGFMRPQIQKVIENTSAIKHTVTMELALYHLFKWPFAKAAEWSPQWTANYYAKVKERIVKGIDAIAQTKTYQTLLRFKVFDYLYSLTLERVLQIMTGTVYTQGINSIVGGISQYMTPRKVNMSDIQRQWAQKQSNLKDTDALKDSLDPNKSTDVVTNIIKVMVQNGTDDAFLEYVKNEDYNGFFKNELGYDINLQSDGKYKLPDETFNQWYGRVSRIDMVELANGVYANVQESLQAYKDLLYNRIEGIDADHTTLGVIWSHWTKEGEFTLDLQKIMRTYRANIYRSAESKIEHEIQLQASALTEARNTQNRIVTTFNESLRLLEAVGISPGDDIKNKIEQLDGIIEKIDKFEDGTERTDVPAGKIIENASVIIQAISNDTVHITDLLRQLEDFATPTKSTLSEYVQKQLEEKTKKLEEKYNKDLSGMSKQIKGVRDGLDINAAAFTGFGEILNTASIVFKDAYKRRDELENAKVALNLHDATDAAKSKLGTLTKKHETLVRTLNALNAEYERYALDVANAVADQSILREKHQRDLDTRFADLQKRFNHFNESATKFNGEANKFDVDDVTDAINTLEWHLGAAFMKASYIKKETHLQSSRFGVLDSIKSEVSSDGEWAQIKDGLMKRDYEQINRAVRGMRANMKAIGISDDEINRELDRVFGERDVVTRFWEYTKRAEAWVNDITEENLEELTEMLKVKTALDHMYDQRMKSKYDESPLEVKEIMSNTLQKLGFTEKQSKDPFSIGQDGTAKESMLKTMYEQQSSNILYLLSKSERWRSSTADYKAAIDQAGMFSMDALKEAGGIAQEFAKYAGNVAGSTMKKTWSGIKSVPGMVGRAVESVPEAAESFNSLFSGFSSKQQVIVANLFADPAIWTAAWTTAMNTGGKILGSWAGMSAVAGTAVLGADFLYEMENEEHMRNVLMMKEFTLDAAKNGLYESTEEFKKAFGLRFAPNFKSLDNLWMASNKLIKASAINFGTANYELTNVAATLMAKALDFYERNEQRGKIHDEAVKLFDTSGGIEMLTKDISLLNEEQASLADKMERLDADAKKMREELEKILNRRNKYKEDAKNYILYANRVGGFLKQDDATLKNNIKTMKGIDKAISIAVFRANMDTKRRLAKFHRSSQPEKLEIYKGLENKSRDPILEYQRQKMRDEIGKFINSSKLMTMTGSVTFRQVPVDYIDKMYAQDNIDEDISLGDKYAWIIDDDQRLETSYADYNLNRSHRTDRMRILRNTLKVHEKNTATTKDDLRKIKETIIDTISKKDNSEDNLKQWQNATFEKKIKINAFDATADDVLNYINPTTKSTSKTSSKFRSKMFLPSALADYYKEDLLKKSSDINDIVNGFYSRFVAKEGELQAEAFRLVPLSKIDDRYKGEIIEYIESVISTDALYDKDATDSEKIAAIDGAVLGDDKMRLVVDTIKDTYVDEIESYIDLEVVRRAVRSMPVRLLRWNWVKKNNASTKEDAYRLVWNSDNTDREWWADKMGLSLKKSMKGMLGKDPRRFIHGDYKDHQVYDNITDSALGVKFPNNRYGLPKSDYIVALTASLDVIRKELYNDPNRNLPLNKQFDPKFLLEEMGDEAAAKWWNDNVVFGTFYKYITDTGAVENTSNAFLKTVLLGDANARSGNAPEILDDVIDAMEHQLR